MIDEDLDRLDAVLLIEEQLRLGRDKLAINSVPTFVIDNRLGIPGLVPKDALVSVFRDQLAAGPSNEMRLSFGLTSARAWIP